ncbi:hypothetical protein HYALB_00003377 [Hymenoscyphus albidus]|uniref:F-box domain-containing protein n=1 Tax=Hymenoscyphus albidus TaxID=595503 RepID=A0A9N9LR53_9HELO|nr:hypothetical protein HYALB_00003377 [Hymenoscyphus albidus]
MKEHLLPNFSVCLGLTCKRLYSTHWDIHLKVEICQYAVNSSLTLIRGRAGSGWASETQEFTLTLGWIASSCLVILLRPWFEERGYVWVQKGPANDISTKRKMEKNPEDESQNGLGNDGQNTRNHDTTPNESSTLLRKLPNELLLQIIKDYLNRNYSVCLGLTCKRLYEIHWVLHKKVTIYYRYILECAHNPPSNPAVSYDVHLDSDGDSSLIGLLHHWFEERGYIWSSEGNDFYEYRKGFGGIYGTSGKFVKRRVEGEQGDEYESDEPGTLLYRRRASARCRASQRWCLNAIVSMAEDLQKSLQTARRCSTAIDLVRSLLNRLASPQG